MRILPFVVNGQTLDKADEESFESLVRGSKGYLKCSFKFNRSWDDYVKAVEFIGDKNSEFYYLKDDMVDVPNSIAALPYFRVKVYGIMDSKTQFSTNTVLVRQKRGN